MGDSREFDLFGGRREFSISAKRKEVQDERLSEPESHEIGRQIGRRTDELRTGRGRHPHQAWGAALALGQPIGEDPVLHAPICGDAESKGWPVDRLTSIRQTRLAQFRGRDSEQALEFVGESGLGLVSAAFGNAPDRLQGGLDQVQTIAQPRPTEDGLDADPFGLQPAAQGGLAEGKLFGQVGQVPVALNVLGDDVVEAVGDARMFNDGTHVVMPGQIEKPEQLLSPERP